MGSFPNILKSPVYGTQGQQIEIPPAHPFSYLIVKENQPKIQYLLTKSKTYKEFTTQLKIFLSHNPLVNVIITRKQIIN